MNKTIFIAILVLCGCSATAYETENPPAGVIVADFPKLEIGDKWIFMKNDWLTNKFTKHIIEVTDVNDDGSFETTIDVPELNMRYKKLYDNSYGWIAAIDLTGKIEIPVPQPPRKTLNFPLWVGKKWQEDKIRGWSSSDKKFYNYRNYYHVKEYKEVKTPAGNFMAFKIWKTNYNMDSGKTWYRVYWYSSEVKYFVRYSAQEGAKMELIEFIPAK